MLVADVARRAVGAVDDYQRRHGWLGFPLAVAKKFGQDRAGGLAALVAYYGFFALFPLLLVFVAVLGFVLYGHPGLQATVVASAKRQFPGMSRYLQVGSIAGSGPALAAGLGVALWAGLGVTRAAQYAMNSVWDVPVGERPNLWRSRLRGLGLLVSLGTAIVVSTGASALRGVGGPLATVFSVVGTVAPLMLNFVLYLVAFQVLTTVHVRWRELVPGAALGAVAWTALQAGGSYYTRHQVAHASQLYGTFAVVIGLLAWIHLGAQVTLYAAELNVVWARRLWPRSLTGEALTEADRRAFAQEASEADRLTTAGDRPDRPWSTGTGRATPGAQPAEERPQTG